MFKFILSLAFFAQAYSLELTPENWDESVVGKTLLVKYFAPWCGHCKKLKPAWDKLMAKYEDSDTVLVAKVDCTAEGKPLCDEVGVKGFPTLKYGASWDLQDYALGRDFESLDHFASELKPVCDVNTLEHCTEAEKGVVEGLKSKPREALEEILADEKSHRETEVAAFESSLKKLQDQYNEMKKEHDGKLAEIQQKFSVGLVKALLQSNPVAEDEDKPEL